MMYIDYYYKEIQPYAIIKGGRCYSMNPDNFAAVWQKGDYVPKVDFDTFNEQVEFNGDKEELYMLCCYILYIQHNIMLIIRIKAHLLLIVGNKIVTKKNEEIALWWASCAKVTKAL